MKLCDLKTIGEKGVLNNVEEAVLNYVMLVVC